MKINYLLSIIFLIISFLLLEKKKSKLNIIHSVIFSICLLFCYQTVVVYFLGFIGSLVYYSIINYLVGFIILFICYKKKRIQKYSLDKKELLLFVFVLLSSIIVCFIKFRGFSVINYHSDDSSIHYRTAYWFSKELVCLFRASSKDLVYSLGSFIPMNYINGGFFLKLFNFTSLYRVYMIYDSFCYVLYSLLFLVIIKKILKKRKSIYYYLIVMIYMLGFPLNNLLFGFGYLGLGVMCVELLYYIFYSIKDNFKSNKYFKMLLIFMVSFSLFYSYYLFFPFVYLSLFIYYIFIFKKDIKNIILYTAVTLVIPFVIGSVFFIVPMITSSNIMNAIGGWGLIYNNITPMFLFCFSFLYVLYRKSKNKKDDKDYFIISYYCLIGYIFIFMILYVFKISELYYFYKLFYIFWFYIIIYFDKYIIKKDSLYYYIYLVIIIGMIFIFMLPYNKVSSLLNRVSIYYYNSYYSTDRYYRFRKKELDIVDKAVKYNSICKYDDTFLSIGSIEKNSWYYAIVGSVPTIGRQGKNRKMLYNRSVDFATWDNMDNYKCIVIFKKDFNIIYDSSKYKELYSNDDGVILMKKVN